MVYNEKLRIEIEAEDKASGKVKRVTDNIKDLGAESSNMGDKFSSSVKNILDSLDSFNSGVRRYNNFMGDFNRGVVDLFRNATNMTIDFTSDAIDNFTELSEQHAKTLGAMANNYDRTSEAQARFLSDSQKLKDQAISLGMYGSTGDGSLINIVGVSQAQTELIKAGVSVDDILNRGAIEAILTFAQANQIDTGSAVEFAVALGNQFNVPIEEWGSMLDKVSHSADLSIVDVKDIVASMKYAGGITSGLDRPMEEVLAMIAILGDFGLKGSQAGSGIQAFITRLLTGDTTVITDRQKAVAPPRALEAFYDFSKYVKSDGSGLTYEDIVGAETYEELGELSGNLRPMDDVMDQLSIVLEELNDEEQAWFIRRLFGLYQMKTAYGLMSGGEEDFEELVRQIEEESDETNLNKLNQILESQYGQLEKLNNMWDGVKTDVGDRLNPLVEAITSELFEFVSNDGKYNINFDNLRYALDESSDLIEEKYGYAISDAIRNIGNVALDFSEVAIELAPEFATGMLATLGKLISFDIPGTMEEWNGMIGNMRASVGNLPEDLQGMGRAVVDVIDFFGKLTALNVVTQIAQLISSALQILTIVGGAVINATSVIVNGTTIGGAGAIGSTTAGAVGSTTAGAVGGAVGGAAGGTGAILSTTWGATGLPLVAGTMFKGVGYAYLLNRAIEMTEDSFEISNYSVAMNDNRKKAIDDFLYAMPSGAFNDMIYVNKNHTRDKEFGDINSDSRYAIREYFKSGQWADEDGDILNAIQTVLMGYNPRDIEFGQMSWNNPYTGKTEDIITYKDKNTGEYLNPIDEYGNLRSGWHYGITDLTMNTKEEFEPMAMYIQELALSYAQLKRARGDDISPEDAGNVTQLLTDKMGEMWQTGEYTMDKDGLFGTDVLLDIVRSLVSGSTTVEDYYARSINVGQGISGISRSLDNIDMSKLTTDDILSAFIPGYAALSPEGLQQSIGKLLDNDSIVGIIGEEMTRNLKIMMMPQINVSAPDVNVNVNVDRYGNITKEVSILDPSFDSAMNKWYGRTASRYGHTTQ